MRKIKVDYVKNLRPIFTKPKRIKIIVGGRGSTKSTGVADYVSTKMYCGELWCCARENQNSIEESVHRTLLDEIARLGLDGFEDTKTAIRHERSGGRAFYRGLARNITSLKSTLSGVDGLWIEEGEDVSASTLRVLTASVRLNATDSERLIAGEDVKMPEIIITMNRGARSGAVAQKWLKRAEADLARCGYYEDDTIMVVQMNYTDMPKSWFEASGLEQERLDDKEQLSVSAYDHKWMGAYLDEVDNSLIKKEWFDAAIDAHEKLGIDVRGVRTFAHDPADGGDSYGYASKTGILYHDVGEIEAEDGNKAAHKACDMALEDKADLFTWDCDGMGALLREQVAADLKGSRCELRPYNGSGEVEDKEQIYSGVGSKGSKDRPKTNADTFKNKRAQFYVKLANRFYNTYQAVVLGKYIDPDSIISISSSITLLDKLRSEVCGVPTIPNGAGKIQLMSKKDMKTKYGIESPGMADCLAMGEELPAPAIKIQPINFTGWK